MQTSESVANIAAALTKFQASPFSKDANNTFHKSKYVTLDKLIDAVKPHLDEVGLVLSSWMDSEGGLPGLTTLLIHADSGEWIRSFFPYSGLDGFKGTSPAQAAGIWTTYSRRYSMSAVLNLPGEKDDDGGSETMTKKSAGGPDKTPTTIHQWRKALEGARKMDDVNRVYRAYAADMDKDSYEHAVLVDDCTEAKERVAKRGG